MTGIKSYQLADVKPLAESGNIRANVSILAPDGRTISCRIVKQEKMRAYLVPPDGVKFTHKEHRHLQREAVKSWADQISGSLGGLLESERVFSGSRIPRLHVQLSVFCPVCDRRTPSDHSTTPAGLIRNACTFCGTLRKGRPFISKAECVNINECRQTLQTNARQGKGGFDEVHAV